MFLYWLVAIVIVSCPSVNNAKKPSAEPRNKEEIETNYWLNNAVGSLNERLLREPIQTKAKYVIVFIGDGMSIPTITAARILKGQLLGNTGEEESLSFDSFPWSGLSKTYCVNSQVADSACSANALFSGVKTNRLTIGVSATVQSKDCKSMRNVSNHIESILSWAQNAGKSTGLVTTSKITDATPAATYAHTASRSWEDDADVIQDKEDPTQCEDIASQLINRNPGEKINVILGGGRRSFRPENVKDEANVKGNRKDGRDLIKVWMDKKTSKNSSASYVWNRDGLMKVETQKTDYVLGLFHNGYLPYALDYKNDQYPTLREMTKVAIEILSKNSEGFFLFVEGGRIDHAHHSNLGKKALYETIEFSNAIQQAVDMTSQKETLIVVTADHSHTMTMSGNPSRGRDILGFAGVSDTDKLPYTTLGYANGPSAKGHLNSPRNDISKDKTTDNNYKYPSLVPLNEETHGGDDVGVFAQGCWAHLFSGVMEQNVIPVLIGYASCLGPHKTVCTDKNQ